MTNLFFNNQLIKTKFKLRWFSWLIGFYGLIFLKFGSTNQVMQNPIPKLRQTSIIPKKPSFSSFFQISKFFVWKIENFDELQLP